jgi:hypothetical protein
MVRKLYHVLFYGEVSEGFRVADVRRNLAQAVDLDEATRQRLLEGKTAILRKHLDPMRASMFMTPCESHGARCRLELARVVTGDEIIDVYRLCTLEFRGDVLPGYALATVKDRLQKALNSTSHTIDRLFSEPSTIIKREVDFETALKLYDLFAKSGARCHILPIKTRLPEDKIFSEAVFRPAHLAMMICPKCEHKQPLADLCERCGVAAQRFTRKMRSLEVASAYRNGQNSADKETPEEYDELGPEYDEPVPPEVYEIVPKQVAVWKIALVGNAILAVLLTFVHLDLTDILVTSFSLLQEAPMEYRGFWMLLYSNANILALTAGFFAIAIYVRRLTFSNHDSASHLAYLLVLIVPSGACLMIDVFISMRTGGGLFVTRFIGLALGCSMIAYGLGWLCFLPYILKHTKLPPSEEEDVENLEEEELEATEVLVETL